jgi:hypothetical protein
MRMRLRTVSIAAFLVVLPSAVSAQRIIYNAGRDEQAKTTATAAEQLTSGRLFETQLANLDEAGKQQLETILRWQEVRMRATLNGFSQWSDVSTLVTRIEGDIAGLLDTTAEQALAQKRVDEIKARAAAIRATLQEVRDKAAGRNDIVEQILSHVGDVKEVVAFAEQLQQGKNASKVQALNEIVASLEQVQKLHAAIKGIVLGHAAVKVSAAALRPDPLQTELELLVVEEEHLNRLGLIRARQRLEVGDLHRLLETTRQRVKAVASASQSAEIEDSLRSLVRTAQAEPTVKPIPTPEQRRGTLEFAIFVLHGAAALAAQHETAADFALLRRSLEERRYSIRRSGVAASTYEQTVRAAAQRLALYWKSGLKPKDVSDFLFHLSGAISLPIIAGKQ